MVRLPLTCECYRQHDYELHAYARCSVCVIYMYIIRGGHSLVPWKSSEVGGAVLEGFKHPTPTPNSMLDAHEEY